MTKYYWHYEIGMRRLDNKFSVYTERRIYSVELSIIILQYSIFTNQP